MIEIVSSLLDPSSADFFERFYRTSDDPWDFAGSAYEQGRYAATMKAIEGRRFHRAFEPGCSIGVLTERLAGVCDAVVAVDLSATAVKRAGERCAGLSGVELGVGSLTPLPDLAGFDLIVLSEIGYYFTLEIFADIARGLVQGMSNGATLLAVHWTGSSKDHRMSGDAVHACLAQQPGVRHERAERHAGFRLDLWVRA